MATELTSEVMAWLVVAASWGGSWALNVYKGAENNKNFLKLARRVDDIETKIVGTKHFNEFKTSVEAQLSTILNLIRNPQTNKSVFMLAEDCGRHQDSLHSILTELKKDLRAMDDKRDKAREQDQNRFNAIREDIAVLRAGQQLLKDDIK